MSSKNQRPVSQKGWKSWVHQIIILVFPWEIVAARSHVRIHIATVPLFISGEFWLRGDVCTVQTSTSFCVEQTWTADSTLVSQVRETLRPPPSPPLPSKPPALSCHSHPRFMQMRGPLIFTMLIQSFQASYLWSHNFMLWLYCMQMRTIFLLAIPANIQHFFNK